MNFADTNGTATASASAGKSPRSSAPLGSALAG